MYCIWYDMIVWRQGSVVRNEDMMAVGFVLYYTHSLLQGSNIDISNILLFKY
jgi:hypothetical protein